VQVAGGFEVQGTPIPTAIPPSSVYLGGLYTSELTGAGGPCSSLPFQLASFTESIPLLPGTTHISFDLDPLQNTVEDEVVVRTALGNWLLRGYPTGLYTEDVGYDYRGDQPLLPAPVDGVLQMTVDAWKVRGAQAAAAFSFRVRVKCWRQSVPIYQYVRCPYSTHPGGAGQRARKFAALFTEMDIETDVNAGLERLGSGVNTYKTTSVESVPLQALTASGAPHRARTPTGAFFTDANWFAVYESANDIDLPELDAKAVSALEGVRPFYLTLTEPGVPPIVQRVKRLGGKMVLYMAQGALTAGTVVHATVHTSRLHSGQQQVTYSLSIPEDIYNASTDTFQKIGEIDISLEDYQFSGPGVLVDFAVVESGATPVAFPCGKPDAVWGLETVFTPSKAHSVSHDGACYQRPTLQPTVDTEASAVVVPNEGCHASACGPVGIYCYQSLNGDAARQFPQPLHFPSAYVARADDPLSCYGNPLFVAELDQDGNATVPASNNVANVTMKRPAPTAKYGLAAIGNVGDFWNTYEFPVESGTTAGFGYLTPIYFGNSVSSGALLAQSVAGPGAIEDPTLTMFRGVESTGHSDAMMAFAGSIPTNMFGGENAFILNVASGTYDIYVYMHGGADDRNGRAHVRTTGHDYGVKSTGTTAAWSGSFTEGAQYVKFANVVADNHVEIVMLSGATGTACYLNGLQVKYKDIADAPTQVPNPAIVNVTFGSLVSYADNSICGDGYLYQQCGDTSQNVVVAYPHATSPHAVVEYDNVCWSRASDTINGSVARYYIDTLNYAVVSVADVTAVPDCLDAACTGTNANGYSVLYIDTQTGMKQPVSFPHLDLGVPVVAACPQVEDSGVTLQPGSVTIHFTKPRVHVFTSQVDTLVEVDVGLQGRTKKLVIVRGSRENALTLWPEMTTRSLSLRAGDEVHLDIGNAVGKLTAANRVRTVVTWKQVVLLPRLYHTATVLSATPTAINALGFTGLTDKQSYTMFSTLPADTAQAFPNPDNIVTVQGTSGPEYVLVRSRAIGDPVAQLPGGLDWYAGQQLTGDLTFRFYTSREDRGAHGEMDVWLDTPGSFPAYVTVDPFRELALGSVQRRTTVLGDISRNSVRAAASATASNYPIVYSAADGQVIAVTKRVNTIVYNNKLFFPTSRFDPGISSRLIAPAQEGSTRLFQGVTYTRRAPFIHVIEIDLTAPGISFQLSGGGGSIDAVTQRTDEFLTAVDAQLAVNTNFFLPANGTDVNVVGFAASLGSVVSLFEPQPVSVGYLNQSYAIVDYAPALNIDQNNVPSIVHRDPGDNGVLEGDVQVWNAMSGSAQIITNGVITIPTYGVELTALNGYSNSFSWYDQNFARCAMGFDVTGKRLYWLCADEASTVGGEGGISVGRAAQILQELGCHNAINLDGGSSVGLAYRKDGVTTVLNNPNNGGTQRRVALSLALFASPL
jgi:hypothetical protein